MSSAPTAVLESPPTPQRTAFNVLLALSFSHLLNDVMQSVIPSIYLLIKSNFALNFAQVGRITLAFQGTASLLQPLVGMYTDRRPLPYSLPLGMGLSFAGLILLAHADSYSHIIVAACLVGLGSSIFHPEASRLARIASGGRHGFAQSLFQVGGNFGSSLGPLFVGLIVMPNSQGNIIWFSALALVGMVVLWKVGAWYHDHLRELRAAPARAKPGAVSKLPRRTVVRAMTVLVLLIFSKYIYLTSLTSYYTFYLVSRFAVSPAHAQYFLFAFLFAVAAGTIVGGPVGDRIGRKYVIWISILGVAPFAWVLPYASLAWTLVLTIIIGFILASAFSAILVYAQELAPGKVGMIAGLFFGIAFGIAAIGSALLGKLADYTGIIGVFHLCRYLPLLGLLTAFLPDLEQPAKR